MAKTPKLPLSDQYANLMGLAQAATSAEHRLQAEARAVYDAHRRATEALTIAIGSGDEAAIEQARQAERDAKQKIDAEPWPALARGLEMRAAQALRDAATFAEEHFSEIMEERRPLAEAAKARVDSAIAEFIASVSQWRGEESVRVAMTRGVQGLDGRDIVQLNSRVSDLVEPMQDLLNAGGVSLPSLREAESKDDPIYRFNPRALVEPGTIVSPNVTVSSRESLARHELIHVGGDD